MLLRSDALSVSQLDAGMDLGGGWSAYQQTDESATLGLTESRIAVGMTTSIADVVDICRLHFLKKVLEFKMAPILKEVFPLIDMIGFWASDC